MRPSPYSKRRSRHKGFTLLEMLVATVILSILLLLLAQTSSMLSNTWASGNGRAERRQSGRALVDYIGQELRAAALPIDRTDPSTLSSTQQVNDLQMVVNPTYLSATLKNPHAAFWQAPFATDATYGDQAILGYFVRWFPGSGLTPPRAALCRMFVNPNPASADYKIYKEKDGWVTDSILERVAPATDGSGYKGLFADNVIGFWVRCFDTQGRRISQNGAKDRFDSRVPYAGSKRDLTGQWVAADFKSPVLPASAEVSLVLLDTRSASMLNEAQASIIQDAARKSDDTALSASDSSNPASKMVQTLQADVSMKRILPGLSSHSLRVYLDNAP